MFEVYPIPPSLFPPRQLLREPVVANVVVEGTHMSLYVEPIGGWVPAWQNPLLAVVAVGSLLVAALVFFTLASRRQHLALLHAMIPKKVCVYVCVHGLGWVEGLFELWCGWWMFWLAGVV